MRAVTNRVFLCLACVIWICIASTLCGCNQTTGFMNNRAGMSAFQQGDYTAARRDFERALADNPQSAHYAFNVAAAMRKQGDILAAERMYKHALTLDPGHQPAYHGLAGMLREQGREAEAQELLTTWNATQPYRAESYVELAWMQREQGDTAGAENSLRRALQVNPRHPAALAHLGQIYQQTGRGREAAGMYQRSLVMNPYQPQVRSQLAQAQQPNYPSPALQMANTTPQQYPTMQAAVPSMPQTAHLPMQPQYSSAPQPYPTWTAPQPIGMPYSTGLSSVPAGPVQSGAAPMAAPQTAHYGPVLPTPNADPAHAPMLSAAEPSVQAF
jgi:Tfp pilus assembly protein PilF